MRQLVDGTRPNSKRIRNGVAILATAGTLVTAGGLMTYAQAAPKVTVSIAPIHSIAAFIMGDVGSPELLVPASSSPHNFAFKPSQAKLLEGSDLVIWVGHELETFLEKPLETIASKASKVDLIDLPGMKLLDPRSDAAFKKDHEGHDHGGEETHEGDHKDHDDHADGNQDHDDHAKAHDNHDHHGGKDPHIWLSTINAKVAATAIAGKLAELDPENAPTYQQNLTTFTTELDQLKSEMKADLQAFAEKPFLVYHNAYHYFEDDFGLNAAGVFSLNPEIKPGAKKLKELSKTLKDRNIVCIFSEPQFSTKSMDLLIAEHPELTIKTGVLDPLGSKIKTGPKHYFQTMTALKDAFVSCLK